MKSYEYYRRKAAGLKECGHWEAAEAVLKMAKKSRRIAKRNKVLSRRILAEIAAGKEAKNAD